MPSLVLKIFFYPNFFFHLHIYIFSLTCGWHNSSLLSSFEMCQRTLSHTNFWQPLMTTTVWIFFGHISNHRRKILESTCTFHSSTVSSGQQNQTERMSDFDIVSSTALSDHAQSNLGSFCGSTFVFPCGSRSPMHKFRIDSGTKRPEV